MTSPSRITLMRMAFATGCKSLGLSQETCLNLTLLLSSLEEIETMVWALEQAEEAGVKWTRTEVVLLAERIKEKYLEKQRKAGIEVVSATNHFKFEAPDGKMRTADD